MNKSDLTKCVKCGGEVIRAHTEDGKLVDLDVDGEVWVYAPRPVDGGFIAKAKKTDPSKLIGLKHVCRDVAVGNRDRGGKAQ